jgi:hypothetical protein
MKRLGLLGAGKSEEHGTKPRQQRKCHVADSLYIVDRVTFTRPDRKASSSETRTARLSIVDDSRYLRPRICL